jgi:hypothetical protein
MVWVAGTAGWLEAFVIVFMCCCCVSYRSVYHTSHLNHPLMHASADCWLYVSCEQLHVGLVNVLYCLHAHSFVMFSCIVQKPRFRARNRYKYTRLSAPYYIFTDGSGRTWVTLTVF